MWGVIKRDLAEFVTVVKTDTVVKASSVVSVVAKGGAEDDSQTAKLVRSIAQDASIFQSDCTDQEALEFDAFKKKFDVGSKTAEISQLLKDDAVLTQRHAEMVPDVVPYNTFWLRYFFRVKQRSTPVQQLGLGLAEDDDDDLGWDQEDEDSEKPLSPSGGAVAAAGDGGRAAAAEAANEAKADSNSKLLYELAALQASSKEATTRCAALEADLALSQRGRAEAVAQLTRLEESAQATQEEIARLRAALADASKVGVAGGDSDVVDALRTAHAAELAGLQNKHAAELQRWQRDQEDADRAVAASMAALQGQLQESDSERGRLDLAVRDLEAKVAALEDRAVAASQPAVTSAEELAAPAQTPPKVEDAAIAAPPPTGNSVVSVESAEEAAALSPKGSAAEGSESEDWGDDWS